MMNKKLEELLKCVPEWPEWATAEALRVLEDIEGRVVWESKLSDDEQAKLAGLRQMVNESIERGGSFTDEEVEASISAALDARERNRKSA